MSDREKNQVLLADAVARNAGAVVTLSSAGTIQHFKSRFLGDDKAGIWVEVNPKAIPQIRGLITAKGPLAVSFKGPEVRMGFTTRALAFNPEFRVNALTTAPAVFVARPEEVKGIQRRNAYRVSVSADSGLGIRLWTIAEYAHYRDRPLPAQELKAQIVDISTGGLRVRLDPLTTGSRKLAPDQRLRVQLTVSESEEILMEGRLRLSIDDDDEAPAVAGVVFKKLENDVKGRQKLAQLTRIVGELQREEVRRQRLGIAG